MPRRVEDFRVDDAPTAEALVRRLGEGGGFTAKAVADGTDLLYRMLVDPAMTVFLSFPADIVATGTRGVLASLIDRGFVDAVVTTCGTLDHDLARSYGPYLHGAWDLDDTDLRRRHLHRLGNVVVPEAGYGPLIEKKLRPILEDLWRKGVRNLSSRELARAIGEALPGRASSSLLRAAFRRDVPVFVPGLTDGAVGSQLWFFWQDHKGLSLDLLSDEQALSDLVYGAKRAGAIVLGGGIAKHHTIWWNQFRDGLDAALYVSSAVEWDGSLSGARPREAISWGKLKSGGDSVHVDGDVTVLFPLMVSAALERLVGRSSTRSRLGKSRSAG